MAATDAKADVKAHVGPKRDTPGGEGVIPNTAVVSKEGCRMRERRVWRPARKPAVTMVGADRAVVT